MGYLDYEICKHKVQDQYNQKDYEIESILIVHKESDIINDDHYA